MANYLQSNANIQVKREQGKILGIFISSTSSGTLTVYDSNRSNTSDPKLLDTFTPAANSTVLNVQEGVWFNKGLYIVVGGTISFTVLYA